MFIFSFLISVEINAQDSAATKISFFENATEYNPSRARIFLIGSTALYVGSMTSLYTIWYRESPRSSFGFFNDNREWMQMDKAGHVVTSYYLGKTAYNLMQWSGMEEKPSLWYGGNVGLLILSTIEVFDGFSRDWGFSVGDMAANLSGAALFIGQQKMWNQQKIILKYSFHQTNYAQHRPDVLGYDLKEQLIKDYNGQTYWLSANISSFINKENNFPGWLNIAAGYGAEGMTGGFENISDATLASSRYRQYYLSLDVDLSRIPMKKGFVKSLLSTVNFIKIPFPSVEFNSEGVIKFHPFYF